LGSDSFSGFTGANGFFSKGLILIPMVLILILVGGRVIFCLNFFSLEFTLLPLTLVSLYIPYFLLGEISRLFRLFTLNARFSSTSVWRDFRIMF